MFDFFHNSSNTPAIQNMKKFIYLVGKPYPQSASVNRIRELGYSVGIFLDTNVQLKHPDLYDRVILLDFSSYKDIPRQLQNIKDLRVDGLICIYENYVLAKSVLGNMFNLPVPSIESAQLCTDKYLMRQAFMGVDSSITPRYELIRSESGLLNFAKKFSYPLIMKPTGLVKSLLVLRSDNEVELLNNYAFAKANIKKLYNTYHVYDRKPEIIIEEYVSGKSCSMAAFIDQSEKIHFCEGIASLTTAKEIGVADNYLYARQLPGIFSKILEAQLTEVAIKGIKALGMKSTPAHVELMYSADGVKIIEIGARLGGYRSRMYQYCYGVDLIEQEVHLALGQHLELRGSFANYCGTYELFPEKEGKFISLQGLVDPESYAYFSIKAKPGQLIGPAKNGYKAAAIIITTAPDKDTFLKRCHGIDSLKVMVSA
jgi:biotin carboxylase